MDFEFPDDIPEFWFANHPFRTLLLTGLSGTFPAGERFFVDSVRHFQEQVQDPQLRAAIRDLQALPIARALGEAVHFVQWHGNFSVRPRLGQKG